MRRTILHRVTGGAAQIVILCVASLVCLEQVPGAEGTTGRKRQTDQEAADALFTNGVLHVLKIAIPKEGVRSLRQDGRKYVKATLRDGSVSITNVMIRLKGGAGSYRGIDDKPGLTLNMGEANGTFHGLRKFHLNNSVQDDTHLSEWVCSEIFRQAGVPAGRVAHAVVEVNGTRLGMYVLLESINSDFLASYFKHPHGNVYSLGANADINGRLEQMGGREQTKGAELRRLAAAARETDLERLRAQLPQVLDVPRFLSFMAVEVLLDHWDGYTFNVKNYEVYHDVDTDRIVFMPHDLDQMFRNESTPIMPRPQGIVARAILRDPVTRSSYRERFEEVFTNYFVASALARRIDDRVARLTPQLQKYDPDLARNFAGSADDLKGRILRRARAVRAQLKVGQGTDRTRPRTTSDEGLRTGPPATGQ